MNMSTELVTDLTSLLCELQLRFSWRPNLRDEGDNKFIEAAIHAAAVVVTYNVTITKGLTAGSRESFFCVTAKFQCNIGVTTLHWCCCGFSPAPTPA